MGEGDSGGGSEGGNPTLLRTLAEPSSPCPITLRYKHPLEWTASCNPETGQISVKRPTGSSISFQSSDGHAEASVSGSSRKLNYKVQKLNADKFPCTGGSPAYLDMVQSNGRTLRFSATTGKVVSMVSVSHNDNTPGWEFTYNHLGQMTSVRDASGIRECFYDAYGHMIQNTSFGTVENCTQEQYDALGRSNGYRLILGTRTVQHSHLDYDSKGAIIGMNLEGLESPFTWQYDQPSGFLHHLTYPNGMVRCNTYHPRLDLVTAISYRKGADGELAAGHEYGYDALMRPVQRRDSWDGTTPATTRNFTHNSRSGLVEDRISRGGSFIYSYDNIGNRKTAREPEEEVSCDANRLISSPGGAAAKNTAKVNLQHITTKESKELIISSGKLRGPAYAVNRDPALPITRKTLGRVGGHGHPDDFVQIPIPESAYPYFKNPVGGPISTIHRALGHDHSRYTITLEGTIEGCPKIFPLKAFQWQALDSLLNITGLRGIEGLYNYLRNLNK